MAGVILWSTYFTEVGNTHLKDIMIVGHSKGNFEWPRKTPEYEDKMVGIVTPNSDGLQIENVRFYNFENPTGTSY